MKASALLLAIATVVAYAEVKPNGTVLSDLCGNPYRSVQACEASVVGSPNTRYIVLRGPNQQVTYARVAQVLTGRGGRTLIGFTVAPDERFPQYQVETRIILQISKGQGGKSIGKLTKGSYASRTFEMQPVFHTQDVE